MTGLIEPFGDPDAPSRDAGAPVAPPAFATAVVSPVAAPEPAPSTEKMATLSTRTPPAPETPPPPPADEQPPTLIEPLTPAPATQGGLSTNQSVETPLVATLTADDGVMHPLLEESSTIGRTAANAIALRDPSVSAKHARIVRGAGGFTIEDLSSRNGTYVNSEKLSEKRLLAEGDLVRLGKIILTFNLASNVQRKQSTEREMMK
jgi:pSer/pThr/pTyr-binding forkhead associated (FHA) protein